MRVKKKQDDANLESTGFQNLAKNLEGLLKSNHLNAPQLAQILGIPMMTIRRLTSGETVDPRISTLKLIADYFEVSMDFLLEDNQHNPHSLLNKTKSTLIPTLDWQTAEKFDVFQNLNLKQCQNWQSVSLGEKDSIGKNAFALKSRPSMYPRFPQGTLFIINPDTPPTDGDIVLVRIKDNNELTLRELTIDPPEWTLHPVVASSSILPYSTQNHKIVGVNILTILYNRK